MIQKDNPKKSKRKFIKREIEKDQNGKKRQNSGDEK